MKTHLILLCAVVLFTASCKNNSNNQSSVGLAINPTDSVSETLNGINSYTAETLIKQFEKDIYRQKKLPKLNFWFNLATIRNMLNVIDNDKKAGRNVDGIRIYFTGSVAGRSSNILLITTEFNGIVGEDTLHRDYYRHSAKEGLFSDPERFGLVFDRNNRNGSVLYDSMHDSQDGRGCGQTNHRITRRDAEEMVQGFGAADTAFVNTQAVWFPIGVFRNIVNDTESDGMRIYFARGTPQHNEENRKNRDTFVITSTKQSAYQGYHEDFFYCNNKEPFTKEHFTFVQDNGSLCPNNCNN